MKRFLLTIILLVIAAPVLATPKIQSWQTGNGAKVLFVHAPALPMIDVRVVFDAGSARDGDVPGLALFTNSLLTEGAGKWSADEIAERLENVGAELGSDSLRDMGLVSLRSLTDKDALDTALETMAVVIAKPSFEQTAVDRNLQAMKILLRQEEQSPASIASKAFYKAMYGKHSYAHPSNGTKESLEKLNAKLARKFHQSFYVARNAVIAMVGDVDRKQAEAIAEKLTSQLPAGQPALPLKAVTPLAESKNINIDYPSKQAHLFIGQPVMQRGDPDYFPLYVGNHVLGGSGLVSQLAVEIREKRGLAYSVYSYFSPMRNAGPFMMGAQTQNATAKTALDVLRETLHNYIEKGPTEKELKRSKQNITGGFPLRIASNKNIVQYLGMIGFYDMPLDYLDTFVGKIEGVTAEQIRDAFKRRLNPDMLATVVVGQVESDG